MTDLYLFPFWSCCLPVWYFNIAGPHIWLVDCNLQQSPKKALLMLPLAKFLIVFLQLNDIFVNSQRDAQELNLHLDNYVCFMRDYGWIHRFDCPNLIGCLYNILYIYYSVSFLRNLQCSLTLHKQCADRTWNANSEVGSLSIHVSSQRI